MPDNNKDVLIQWLLIINPIAYSESDLKKASMEEIEKKFALARKTQIEADEN